MDMEMIALLTSCALVHGIQWEPKRPSSSNRGAQLPSDPRDKQLICKWIMGQQRLWHPHFSYREQPWKSILRGGRIWKFKRSQVLRLPFFSWLTSLRTGGRKNCQGCLSSLILSPDVPTWGYKSGCLPGTWILGDADSCSPSACSLRLPQSLTGSLGFSW